MLGIELLTASVVFGFGGAITMSYQYLSSLTENPIAARVKIKIHPGLYNGYIFIFKQTRQFFINLKKGE